MEQVSGNTEPEADVIVENRQFATEPMLVIWTDDESWSEEALHASFEQAITNRLQAYRVYCSAIQEPATETTDQRHTAFSLEWFSSTALLKQFVRTRLYLLSTDWQRSIQQVSLALLLLLTGFDVMGMLVLSLR